MFFSMAAARVASVSRALRGASLGAPRVRVLSSCGPTSCNPAFPQPDDIAVSELLTSVQSFASQNNVDEAQMPPTSWFTSSNFLNLERQHVFDKEWLHVGHVGQLAEKGQYLSGIILGEPFVVVNDEGSLKAFYNVCRHRAAPLVQGDGTIEKFSCPYHGWEYRLDGKLLKAPRVGGMKNFKARDMALLPLEVQTWGPLVFIRNNKNKRSAGPSTSEVPASGGPAASYFDKYFERLAPLKKTLDDTKFSSGLKFVRRIKYTLECNWKVFSDNYLDGGYHVSSLHGDLSGQLDLASYKTEVSPGYSLQSCSGSSSPAAPSQYPSSPSSSTPSAGDTTSSASGDFRERLGGHALYAYIYPNLMLNRYGCWLDSNTVYPLGPQRCEVVFDYFVDTEAATKLYRGSSAFSSLDDFVTKSLKSSAQVQAEDTAICNHVQIGMASRGYLPGRYAPRVEHADFWFHKYLCDHILLGAK